MDGAVNAMSDACDEFVKSAADFLLSRAASDGVRTPESDDAMQSFKDKWELFNLACDHAEDIVLTARRRLAIDDVDCNVNDCQIAEPSNTAGSNSGSPAAVSPSSPSQNSGFPATE